MDFLIALGQDVGITVRPTRKEHRRYRLSLLDQHCAAPSLLIRQSLTLASAPNVKSKDATPIVRSFERRQNAKAKF